MDRYAPRQRPQFGRSGRWGGLSGSVSWSFSCWPGPIGCVCVWWGWSGVVTALRGGAGLREVPGRRIAGRQQVHELAAADESLSMPGVGESCPVVLAGRSPAGEPGAGGAPACGSGELDGAVHTCTRDRRRGWPGARTYGGQRRRSGHPLMVFTQVTGQVEVEAGAVCKTVGSGYVGSNPTPATTPATTTPATTCGNGPLAANSRAGGPFLLCPGVCHLVALRAAMLRCPRTHSGRASVLQGRSVCTVTTVGVHSSDGRVTPSAFHGRPRTGRADAVSGAGGGRRSRARLPPRPSAPRAPSRDKCRHGMEPVAVLCPSRDGPSEVAAGSRGRGDIRAPPARTTTRASGCRRPSSLHESYHRA